MIARALLPILAAAAAVVPASAQQIATSGSGTWSLDLSGPQLPKEIVVRSGSVQVATVNGVRALQIPTETDFDIVLPDKLPERFTLSFDLVLPAGWASSLQVRGFTPDSWNGPANTTYKSAHDVLRCGAIGTGVEWASGQTVKRIDDKPLEPLKCRFDVNGGTIEAHLNGELAATRSEARFARSERLHFFVPVRSGEPPAVISNLVITGIRTQHVASAPAPAANSGSAAAGTSNKSGGTANSGLTVSALPADVARKQKELGRSALQAVTELRAKFPGMAIDLAVDALIAGGYAVCDAAGAAQASYQAAAKVAFRSLVLAVRPNLESTLTTLSSACPLIAAITGGDAISVFRDVNIHFSQWAKVHMQLLKMTAAQYAALLRAQALSAFDAAEVLRPVAATDAAVGKLLVAAGYAGDRVAAALFASFNAGAQRVAEVLQQAGLTRGAVLKALRDGLQTRERALVAAVRAIWSADQIVAALREISTTRQNATEWMRAEGYKADQIVKAVRTEFGLTEDQVMDALNEAGYARVEAIQAARSSLLWSLERAVKYWFSKAPTTPEPNAPLPLPLPKEVAKLLADGYNVSGADVARELRKSGANAPRIALLLKSELTMTADQAALALKQAQFNAVEITTALQTIFALTTTEIAKILKAIGL